MEGMESASKQNVRILGLSEINTNMALESNQREIKYDIRSKWKTQKLEDGTYIGKTHETHIQGGTLIVASERYVNRIRGINQYSIHTRWNSSRMWKWRERGSQSF